MSIKVESVITLKCIDEGELNEEKRSFHSREKEKDMRKKVDEQTWMKILRKMFDE